MNDIQVGDRVEIVNVGGDPKLGFLLGAEGVVVDTNYDYFMNIESYDVKITIAPLAAFHSMSNVRNSVFTFDLFFLKKIASNPYVIPNISQPAEAIQTENSCTHNNKVKSHAGGQYFWYCRDCKNEVD